MKRTLLLLLPCCFIFFACKKEAFVQDQPAQTSSLNNDLAVYQKLLQVGFLPAAIQTTGDYYLVDGDLLFHKKNADTAFITSYFSKVKESFKSPAQRHWITSGIVSEYNIENLKIETDEFANNGEITDWRRSAQAAMSHWAGIPGTLINFIKYFNIWSGPRYINIIDDGGVLQDFVIAAAEFPTNNNPGFQIRVNLDFLSNSNVPDGQRVYNLVHELGHCFGFRHTNWQLNGEGQMGAVAINTTSASQDPNSVMNGGTALNSWAGFSTDDVIAAQTIYPSAAFTNWLTSPNSGKFPMFSHFGLLDPYENIAITWNSGLVTTSTVTLQVFRYGSLIQTIASGIPNNGSFNFPVFPVADNNWGMSSAHEVQIKIIADDNPAIFDFTSMFDISVD